MFNEKIKQEMKKSSTYAHQATHWENKYNLLYKKHEDVRSVNNTLNVFTLCKCKLLLS